MYEQIVAWWQTKNIQTDADLEEAFNGHVISFAYNSSNIENPNVTYHDTCEIFEHDGVTSYTGDIRTLFEIRNAKLANEYFFAAFNERKPIDENLIKEIQKRLTLNTYDPLRWKKGERPGEYKKGDYVTGKNETGAWPEDVPDEMQELKEKDELQKAVDESRTQYKIAIKDSGINQRRAAMQFARSFDELDDDTAIKILKLLKDKEDRNN